jgi:hypothetical protein
MIPLDNLVMTRNFSSVYQSWEKKAKPRHKQLDLKPYSMTKENFKRLTLLFFIIASFAISCKRKESTYYEFKRLEFTRRPDTVQTFMLFLQRIKYDPINDSMIQFAIKTDSVKDWHSSKYFIDKGISDTDPKNQFKLDSIQRNEDQEFLSLKQDHFNFPGISKRTRIINLQGVDDNDTLMFESEKKLSTTNLYSFYYHFNGFDGDYRLFLADSIGPVAFYSVAWKALILLDKIKNSQDLDNKWQRLKYQLLRDSLFFPIPTGLMQKNRYVAPYKPN